MNWLSELFRARIPSLFILSPAQPRKGLEWKRGEGGRPYINSAQVRCPAGSTDRRDRNPPVYCTILTILSPLPHSCTLWDHCDCFHQVPGRIATHTLFSLARSHLLWMPKKECRLATQHHHVIASPWGGAKTCRKKRRTHPPAYNIIGNKNRANIIVTNTGSRWRRTKG